MPKKDDDHWSLVQAVQSDLRSEASRLRRLSERLAEEAVRTDKAGALSDRADLREEASRITEAATRQAQEAYRLEREADAIYWLGEMVRKAKRRTRLELDEDTEAAVRNLSGRMSDEDKRLLDAMRSRAVDGVAEATLPELMQAAGLTKLKVRRGIGHLIEARQIRPARPDKPSRRGGTARWKVITRETNP